jgi:hypothetical protein
VAFDLMTEKDLRSGPLAQGGQKYLRQFWKQTQRQSLCLEKDGIGIQVTLLDGQTKIIEPVASDPIVCVNLNLRLVLDENKQGGCGRLDDAGSYLPKPKMDWFGKVPEVTAIFFMAGLFLTTVFLFAFLIFRAIYRRIRKM